MGVRTRSQTVLDQPKLPVTLLSGFLGAGKTTLLQHILQNKQNLKCAVIVNDMAEINIDASLIKGVNLIQAEEKLVEMQNGCICCTLREDLIEEVGRLAKMGRFEYLIIESTGISEPMQVAETFDMEVGGTSLKELSKLDTCVTVIDASNLELNLSSIKKVKDNADARKTETEEDDRNLADLLVDQIEFSDVIILNKTDLVSPKQLKSLEAFIKTMNPGARLISTREAKVDLKELLNTGRFDMEKAQRSAGWLQSLIADGPIVPESEEYGISSFVYRARKPFHPLRLWEFVSKYFHIQQPTMQDTDKNDMLPAEPQDDEMTILEDAPDPILLAVKQANLHDIFGQVLRAKGFFWLAGRDDLGGEWSQAGSILRLTSGAPWFVALPKEVWPDVNEAEVLKDFHGVVGDRRQELVFIGLNIKEALLSAALDACLCEIDYQVAFKEDPFVKWPELKLEYEEVEVEVEVTDDDEVEEDGDCSEDDLGDGEG